MMSLVICSKKSRLYDKCLVIGICEILSLFLLTVISDDMHQEQDDNKSLREKMLKGPSDENSHIFQV